MNTQTTTTGSVRLAVSKVVLLITRSQLHHTIDAGLPIQWMMTAHVFFGINYKFVLFD
jgi:hypothetical protein